MCKYSLENVTFWSLFYYSVVVLILFCIFQDNLHIIRHLELFCLWCTSYCTLESECKNKQTPVDCFLHFSHFCFLKLRKSVQASMTNIIAKFTGLVNFCWQIFKLAKVVCTKRGGVCSLPLTTHVPWPTSLDRWEKWKYTSLKGTYWQKRCIFSVSVTKRERHRSSSLHHPTTALQQPPPPLPLPVHPMSEWVMFTQLLK